MQNDEVRQSVAEAARRRATVYVCDVEHEEQIARLRDELAAAARQFHGLVHSIAFADYSDGMKPFHETPQAGVPAGGRHLLLLADRAVPTP